MTPRVTFAGLFESDDHGDMPDCADLATAYSFIWKFREKSAADIAFSPACIADVPAACRLKFTATVEEGGLSISTLARILTHDQDQDTLFATLMCGLLKGMGKARGAG